MLSAKRVMLEHFHQRLHSSNFCCSFPHFHLAVYGTAIWPLINKIHGLFYWLGSGGNVHQSYFQIKQFVYSEGEVNFLKGLSFIFGVEKILTPVRFALFIRNAFRFAFLFFYRLYLTHFISDPKSISNHNFDCI